MEAFMKRTQKKTPAIPNPFLKMERELRGWSQKYVADCIGADHYYLSRWERGTASPSPYYRQKLCDLFGKNADQLGLLHTSINTNNEHDEKSQDAASSHIETTFDYAIPPLTIDMSCLIGRNTIISRLKEQLCSDKSIRVAALNGLPGAGKTTLAVTLAHDNDVINHFSDGILWAGLGPQPNILEHLSRWGSLLGIIPAEAKRLTSTEAWTQAIRAAIGRRRMLLVIDDIWELQEALAFKIGGPYCSYLVTTRFPSIAAQWAGKDAIVVSELNESDSIALLVQLVPELITQKRKDILSLVQSVGGLPLALMIVGKYLRTSAYNGQPRRIQTALEKLKNARERLNLDMLQAIPERSPSLPVNTPVSLQTAIHVSDQQLNEQAQIALRALSAFPPKPSTFSEEAALVVSQVPVEVIDILTDAGLLENSGPDRYSLHQVIADYAREYVQENTSIVRFVQYFIRYVETYEYDYVMLERESTNITAAFDYIPSASIYGVNIYARFLIMRGLYEQAQHFLKQAEETARQLNNSIELASTLLNLGKIAQRLAHYTQAEKYLQEGLMFARQHNNSQLICDLLLSMGGVVAYQGEPLRAEDFLREALALAEQYKDTQRICAALKTLGACESDQGKYAQAEVSLKKALPLARLNEDREQLIEVLVNLGQTAALRGDYALATNFWQEALGVARQIGYRHSIQMILGNLGAIATEQGQNKEAQEYLQEGLQLARQMDDPSAMVLQLANLGALAIEQEDYDKAEVYLQEAVEKVRLLNHPWLETGVLNYWGNLHLARPDRNILLAATSYQKACEIAASGGYREYYAEALYGLARVAAMQGDSAEACQKGQESLFVFQDIGNRLAGKVRQWLKTVESSTGSFS